MVFVGVDCLRFISVEKASRVSGYTFPDPCAFSTKSYCAPFLCDMYNSSDHDISSCPYYTSYVQSNFASTRDNINIVLTFSSSSFALARCKGHKAGKPFGFVARFDVDACSESEVLLMTCVT